MNRCALIHHAWVAMNRRRWRRFRRALHDPAAAQAAVLRQHLAANADCCFAREHGLTGDEDIASFRARVPIRGYDGHAPYIDRIRAGEPNVLTCEPVTRLTPSSGSTAACKLIPWTAKLLMQFNRAIGPWVVDLFDAHRQLYGGPAYWSISPAIAPPDLPSAVPIGFEDDRGYLGRAGRLIGAAMAVPGSVRRITHHDDWLHATLDHLMAARELRLISVWHPSYLSLLLDAMRERRGIDDVQRAWPRLRVVSCWTDGQAGRAARQLANRLPGVVLEPKGLIATEAAVSIPFGGARPLAVCSHLLEFVDEAGEAWLADQLDVGGTYRVVVTTAGGLWRYDLGDLIRVEGRIARTPSVRFVGRADAVSDLRGEKLSDGFVGEVLAEASRATDTSGGFVMLAPSRDQSAYELFVQQTSDLSESLGEMVERALLANPHYAYCRRLGQLGPIRVRRLSRQVDAAGLYLRAKRDAGACLGNVKLPYLSLEPLAMFEDACEQVDEERVRPSLRG